jgi:hypothetical protein
VGVSLKHLGALKVLLPVPQLNRHVVRRTTCDRKTNQDRRKDLSIQKKMSEETKHIIVSSIQ